MESVSLRLSHLRLATIHCFQPNSRPVSQDSQDLQLLDNEQQKPVTYAEL